MPVTKLKQKDFLLKIAAYDQLKCVGLINQNCFAAVV